MKKDLLKKGLPHLAAIVFFLFITAVYFSPIMQGKSLKRHDISTWTGAAQEAKEFKEQTGETTLWTNSMFGGMPTYLINNLGNPILGKVHRLFTVWKSEPMGQTFLYLIGFYLALIALGISPFLAVLGAVAFAFSSYFFIIIQAGHATKAFAIGYMAPIIAGVYLSFTKKPLWGALLAALFLALQIRVNHFQITYYTALIILVFGVFWLVKTIREKAYQSFLKALALNVIGVLLAIGANSNSLYLTFEYGKYSIRGASELTHNQDNQTSGLDKDYATAWSYGIDETLTLLVPNFKGGGSAGSLPENSATYKLFEQAQGKAYAKKVVQQLPLYWGTQPMTSGPVYVGAIICFLFIMGLFVVKGPVKWWLLTVTLLSIVLAWGKNFMFLTDLFLEYFPGYNKFRTVSMTLVIAEFAMPFLAILGLKELISGKLSKKTFMKALYWSFGITGGLSLVLALFAGAFSFQAPSDAGMQQILVDALQTDRQMLLRNDAWRSFLFIAVAAILVLAAFHKKLENKYFFPALILLVLFDMWPVNKRYLNESHFVTTRVSNQEFQPTQADQFILKDKDPNFRVLNLTVSTFNDATTSYYHKSIGGYHGAKMRRYQELIDYHIAPSIQRIARNLQQENQTDYYGAISNEPVLNMLNTKFVIVSPESFPIYNPGTLGNAWYVDSLKMVDNADAEIEALYGFNPAVEAVINKNFELKLEQLAGSQVDSSDFIRLETYKPNYLKYRSKTGTNRLAVFSEIYYPKGWHAFIDGIPADYLRANYVLRAMVIPKGEHLIEWRFEPASYKIGKNVSYASSALLMLLILGFIVSELKKQRR
ncbi:MAG: hypothetical protein CVU09_03795 [Bacteroidetes bacterium HGW-Bacteroidetes-4]|jgi:hypothetical protein|nr:MAG: hypothetical protein CVU09_03795 [Bacteroidetes bacterium HGW-Bacteroidetes-4]